MSDTKETSLEIPPEIAHEFSRVSKHFGFDKMTNEEQAIFLLEYGMAFKQRINAALLEARDVDPDIIFRRELTRLSDDLIAMSMSQ